MRILAALLALGFAGAATAADPSGTATLASLPEQVRELLERRYGEIGDAGAPFSRWCQIEAGTYRARLVSIDRQDQRLLVRFEQGGRGGPRTTRAEYRIEDGAWTEVGMPPLPPAAAPPMKWSGQPRSFDTVLHTVLPPLTGALTPPFALPSP